MADSNFDLILNPSEIVITKKSVQIIEKDARGRNAQGIETHPLPETPMAFSLFQQRNSTERIRTESSSPWLFLFIVFSFIAYASLSPGWLSLEFAFPALLASVCLLFFANLEFRSQPGPVMQYGLIVALGNGQEKLLPSPNKKQVLEAIEEIDSFLNAGAYSSHIRIINSFFGMRTIVERYVRD